MSISVSPDPVYQIRIELMALEPAIWRQVRVPGSLTLDQFHLVIQLAMGWENAHLYSFKVGPVSIGSPEYDQPSGTKDSTSVRLRDLGLKVRGKFLYEYDFGDSWLHTIRVEKVEVPDTPVVPECLAGQHACPPEDCGGPDGYVNLVMALHDPRHPDHDHYREWMNEPFDPFAFDLASTNKMLKSAFKPRTPRKRKA